MRGTVFDSEEFSPSWRESALPVEIDYGCHKGTFLVAMAERYPEIRFLGIERQASRVEKCLAKIARLQLSNAHAIRREGLGGFDGVGANAIHVSFPDPWPKRRHWDRRLVNERFLEDAWLCLRPGGMLRLMTDDEPYFEAMQESVQRHEGFFAVEWEDGREYPMTEFQKKFVEIGQPVHRLALVRCSSMSSR